ncbi:MAG: DctP family TRAP transporter solute-binding subunit [Candidatus Sedimenticola sp. (ex Thyasira tokunagai)]
MKKVVWIAILGVLLAIVFLPWMSPEQSTEKLPQNLAQQAALPIYDLRFGHNIPATSALHLASVRFAETVKEKTRGKVRVTVYPAQQLGNDHQMVEMARAGELDIILTPTAKMSVPVPAIQYADLPFYFPTPEDLYEMLDGEPGQMLLDKLRNIGLIGVTFWENGFKHFTGNRPLQSPEDFAGLKIRTMKSRIIMEQFKSFGAHPVPIDFHATRKALADGVVDGQENPLVAIVSMGFHEVQSDLTISNHAYLGYVFSISEKVFDKLPGDIQEILISTARELTTWEREETHRREGTLLETIRQAGVRIHTLDTGAHRRFAAKTGYIPALFEEIIGADVLSKTEELMMVKRLAADGTNRPIIIGLDADLSLDAKISGLAIKRGATLAMDEINERGGVLGREFALLALNHRGMPSQGTRNIAKLVANSDVVGIIGGQHSPVIMAEKEMLQTNGIPFLASWSSTAEVVETTHEPNYIFRVSANDRLAGPFMIDYVLSEYKRPAIMLENSVWGRGNLRHMSSSLMEKGASFVQIEKFNRGDKNFSPLLDRINAAGADSIIMIAKPQEGQYIVNTLARQATPLSVISHWGITGGDFWKMNKSALSRVDLSFFQTVSLLDSANKPAMDLGKSYAAHYGIDSSRQIKAPTGVAHAYDIVQLMALAIEQAGTTERAAVRNALENLPPYQGVVKRYDPVFTATEHDALTVEDYRMAKFDEDGAIVPLTLGIRE